MELMTKFAHSTKLQEMANNLAEREKNSKDLDRLDNGLKGTG